MLSIGIVFSHEDGASWVLWLACGAVVRAWDGFVDVIGTWERGEK